jgi:molybdopterin converting factor subunit 1
MLSILFFASIREQLGIDRLELPLVRNIETLIDVLSREHGVVWSEVLRAENVIVAVNQRIVGRGENLRDGDELAFYPPVTGG